MNIKDYPKKEIEIYGGACGNCVFEYWSKTTGKMVMLKIENNIWVDVYYKDYE